MKVLTLEELLDLDIPDPAFIVDGMFAEGASVLFSAPGKSGKSFLMLDCLTCVAEGKPFLGRHVKQGPTLYLALEDRVTVVRDRARTMTGGRRDIPIHFAPLDGSFEGQTLSLEDAFKIEELRDVIREIRPVMTVLDVLIEAHESDENDAGDMARVMKPPRQLAHEFNTCIVLTHHTNREGRSRGSTAIVGAVDDALEFKREDGEDEDGMRGLLTGKGRHVPKLVQRCEFNPDTHRWRAIEGAPAHSQPTNTRERILAILNGTDTWLSPQDLADQIPGASLRTIRNTISKMVKETYRQVLVKGKGTRNDPYLYHGIHKRENTTLHFSGNNPGTNGHHAGPACVECGVPVASGQLYCPKHGGEDGDLITTGNPSWDEMSNWREAS